MGTRRCACTPQVAGRRTHQIQTQVFVYFMYFVVKKNSSNHNPLVFWPMRRLNHEIHEAHERGAVHWVALLHMCAIRGRGRTLDD